MMKKLLLIIVLFVTLGYCNDMSWKKVESKEITSIGYDHNEKSLSVVYVTGDTLTYLNVKRSTYTKFKNAVDVDGYNYRVSSTHVMKK